MEEIRKHFPALESCTYLNTASNGVIPKPVVEWRRQHDLDLMNHASVFRDKHKIHIEEIRKTVSTFFNASVEETALIPNFSFGMNTVLEGLPKKQKILLLKNDYPSINWPVETRDFEICYAEIDENLERNIEEAVVTQRPDVFMFSIVQWLNGIKIDFEFLDRLKSYHPNLLLVADGTQYLGTENFSFAESPIDVLGASAYKWLTAGYGNGFIFVKEAARERIFPKTIGFNSAERFESKASETTFMKHFEPGHQDTLNYGSLQQAFFFQENLGKDALYEKIASLSAKAKKRFAEMDLLRNDTLLREKHSSIYNLKGDSVLFGKLKENNIICSLRGGGIRVSFHYYNTEDELEKLLEVVKSTGR
ncbi:aminotransferase class V-fold PLP-dependent enzyme [Aequorivita sp. SDUM287046]|uniref:Aminotransferase class V-fold PLP-dependent enzyme n=1 Tax=Aequorivita aurantiaca TaxID=3053356 RepID=A0ABT8DIT0_9FLAO|nr:aminotransferase class V-fold PLP-dependent enzyme [Aequorivita aurantiaca]MDN3724719.1 aminotransferase class V-fold PLP-dependent enzyme [Aequorivita aurantiaca]